MTLKQTPLYAQHKAQHARMVDFAGWEMPLHYGSQLEEHRMVRTHAGIFDVSHMNIVDIQGKDAQVYLRYLLANDIAKLTTPGRALYSCMLNLSGGVIDDLIVYYLAPQHYRLILNAARYVVDIDWLNQHKKNFVVQILPQTQLAIIALQGPSAQNIAESILSGLFFDQLAILKPFHFVQSHHLMVARTGYTGEDGFEIILPAENAVNVWQHLIGAGAVPVGLGARDSLRLEAGLPLYGNELDEHTTPLESNLSWTIVWQPETREFMGRAALWRQQQQGVPKICVGVVLEKGGILRQHQKIIFNQQSIGEITSGGFSPILNCSIALARIENKPLTHAEVELRGKIFPVRIVKPCFVRKGKVQITALT